MSPSSLSSTVSPDAQLDLAGAWQLRSADGRVQCPIELPGDVHSALLEAGLIPDPYIGTNEEEVQWVGETGWILERDVPLPAAMLEAPSVYLNAAVLDTFCEIFINGVMAGSAGNAFRRHRFEVRSFLRGGENRFTLRFRSAAVEMQARAEKLAYPLPYSTDGRKIPHWNLTRKPMCHAGWDWGIALSVAGVYGDLSLRATHSARIEHVYTRQEFAPDGRCRLHVTAEVCAPAAGALAWEVEIDGHRVASEARLAPGSNVLHAPIVIDAPQLWWPVGFGGQPLYELRVRAGDETVRKRIGLRTLAVKNDPDQIGRPLTFCVNGVDVFCKGADWIPCDALPSRQTPANIRELIESARAAHMNMLRVWGGGQFEPDVFYDTCDELGILVWQDFMFACAMYPVDAPFLEEVRAETEYQVTRLRDHPCIALWCGDNENIGAMNWFEETKRNRALYLGDWSRLDAVRGAAALAADETRTYWPSSPCAGPGDLSDPFHEAAGKGDMHYWAVFFEGKKFDACYAVRPRFCSEFGYQSFPSLETVRTYCPPDQWSITSPVMLFHQRHPDGNRLISDSLARYFHPPKDFASELYLSQVQQAVAVKTHVEFWRSLRPECMGTIYWQLNDVWPVASWSSLEYGGKWKQLHHHARRFYAPVVTCVLQRGDHIDVWVVNDRPAAAAATVFVECWAFTGKARWQVESINAEVPAGSARIVKSYLAADLLPEPNQPASGFLQVTLEATVGAEHLSHENTHWFTEYRNCTIPYARVQSDPRGSKVTLTTDSPAFFVQMDAAGRRGEFDDNSFTLLPGRPRTLRFDSKDGQGASLGAVEVMHLARSY